MIENLAPPIVLATRPSALAQAQTQMVCDALQSAWPGLHCSHKVIETQGDRDLARPLPEMGGKGAFTLELERALLAGEVDLAVHSLKDLPVEASAGLRLGAVLMRDQPGDCLLAEGNRSLEQLPAGAVVGTSSLRRAAQVLARRPDLVLRSIRGNVETRVRKLRQGDVQALVLAVAGLTRLGLQDQISQRFDPRSFLPAPGQGALAIQCRSEASFLSLLARIDDAQARAATTAERAFLQVLGGGCSAPIGAFAEPEGGRLRLRALVISLDGKREQRFEACGSDAEQLGRELAGEALERGAAALIDGN